MSATQPAASPPATQPLGSPRLTGPARDPGRRLVLLPSTRRMRGRVVLALDVALLAGLGLPYLLAAYGDWFRRLLYLPCSTQLSDVSGICRTVIRYPSLRSWILALPIVIVLGLGLVLLAMAARWCLAPIREAVAPIAAVGPQNLGYRIGRAEPHLRDDPELASLAFAVDSMMERVSAGYEGQRRFAANASHELRTPLSVQRALIEVGFAEDVTPEQLHLLTRQLLATNERNERLIEGLLVLAETDQGLESRTPQRLDEITAGVLAVHAHTAAAAGVELIPRLAPATVWGERVLLERLVTNLIQNGIKYNRAQGQVIAEVSASPQTGLAVLKVANSGEPVPGEAVGGLFEPFRRLRGERIDHSGGAGLGLTIARSIVAAHGGRISAIANETGGGLSITIEFPSGATGPYAPG